MLCGGKPENKEVNEVRRQIRQRKKEEKKTELELGQSWLAMLSSRMRRQKKKGKAARV